MMMTIGLALYAAMLAPSTGGVPVAIADFQKASLPALTKVESKLPHASMTKDVEDILKSRKCTIRGQRAVNFDVVVPFAVLLGPGGVAKKVVVNDLGCNEVERLVAKIMVAQAARGDFVLAPGRQEEWFGSEIYFKNVEPTTGEALADPGKVTCKTSTRVGSRLHLTRVCKTAAEWRAFAQDRQQLGRDIRDGPDVRSE